MQEESKPTGAIVPASGSLSVATAPAAPPEKPDHFTMTIQGGMLEALGINMYTTLGKCLVEFVANAYDADATKVDITIPVDEIAKAREQVRATAKTEAQAAEAAREKAAAAAGTDDDITDLRKRRTSEVLLLALPETIKVVIEDDGHGMTPRQVQDFFLPVNRKRRLDEKGNETVNTTESGKRHAMGRKGLGKLAGFGTAECVSIETKRAGNTYATRFAMRYKELARRESLTEAELAAEYVEGLPAEKQYTRVELLGLKCDAVRNNVESIRHTIAEAFFGILPTEFTVNVNAVLVEPEKVDYEFEYPEKRDAEGFAQTTIGVEMMEPLPFKYVVRFRKMGQHLPAAKRGARIYCNGRLAAGPSLLDLPTGMHNFHAQSYMESIVVADELDRFGVDIINTNRTSLRQDSELVEKLLTTITAIMKDAIAKHAVFREKKADEDVEKAAHARQLREIAKHLPANTRKATNKLITLMAAQHGVESAEFKTIVPLVLNAANASEVLLKLSELGARPETIENVAQHLQELAVIEKSDALKLYRGRKNGILALATLEERGEEQWRQKGSENKLHALFKDDPWLIRPQFGRPVVSNQDMSTLATKLAKELGVDAFAKPQKGGKPDERRPDLVFLMGDSSTPHEITIVELKSPSMPLEVEHLSQLEGYMMKVEEILGTEIQNKHIHVTGILIGAMPDPKTTAEGSRHLLHKIKKRGPDADWMVVGLRQLIEDARAIHLGAIQTLESELGDGTSEFMLERTEVVEQDSGVQELQ